MHYFLATIVFSTLIVVTFKLFAKHKVNIMPAIVLSYVIAAGFGIITNHKAINITDIYQASWFSYALVNGVLFILVFVVFAYSTKKAGIALTSVSSKMSVIIPVLSGIFILGDTAGIIKITGIVLALMAFYLTFRKKKEGGTRPADLLFPMLLFAGTGINDSVMKFAEEQHMQNSQEIYLSVVFSIALVCGVFLLMLSGSWKKGFGIKEIAGGIILGLFNWWSTIMIIKTMGYYDSSVLFPVFNAAIVCNAALIGFLVFREKLRLVNWMGILLAILAIGLISIGG
ncbi:MAG: hypothetical protein Q7J34_09740 [Bacteroidales bacterium]|jgi:multidrug transporter EmrE-like cation transporter|nr:hypothetical protein [Bacteroidales bacterium]